MRISDEVFDQLVAIGLLGKVELFDGRLVMAGTEFDLSPQQRAVALKFGIDVDADEAAQEHAAQEPGGNSA